MAKVTGRPGMEEVGTCQIRARANGQISLHRRRQGRLVEESIDA